jgi:DNA-binding transcriptional MerR regulator
MYRRKDVEYVMQIRKLLYEDGFTIAGAREKLREEVQSNRPQIPPAKILTTAMSPQEDAQESQLSYLGTLNNIHGKEKLRRLREQLCEVLELLS